MFLTRNLVEVFRPGRWLWLATLVVIVTGCTVREARHVEKTVPDIAADIESRIPAPSVPAQVAQLPPEHCGVPPEAPLVEILPPAPKGGQSGDVWTRLRTGLALWDIDNARIERERKAYLSYRPGLNGILEAGRPWLHYLVTELERRRLPMELALLPAVESRFDPFAHSSGRAAGLWQFVPRTGDYLGLKRNWWYDGRRDPVAATKAALDYLERLHRRFDGNWGHTLAAYNAGAGNVLRAIARNRRLGKPTDYWSLPLPQETRRYLPKLLALASFVAHADRYELDLPSIPNQPHFEVVEVGHQIDLKLAAASAGVPEAELLRLNAGFNRWLTPPGGPHRLLVPIATASKMRLALQGKLKKQLVRVIRYRIRQGDTLIGIAARHEVPVQVLRSSNGLRGHRIRAGQHLIIPIAKRDLALYVGERRLKRKRVLYRVRNGDSLYAIAERFRVKISDIRNWNGLERTLLRPGQRLKLMVDPAHATL